jgi:RNA polymerase sigma-70 factor, ECF subfamily
MGGAVDTVRRVPPKNQSPLQEDLARRHFEAAFEAYYGRVLAYSLRRSDDRASAEEATADAFAIAWRRVDDLPRHPLPWLLQTARRVLANQRRSGNRRAAHGTVVSIDALTDVGDQAPGLADRIADRDALARSFAALRPADREVLALVLWDGLTPKEAAEVVGCGTPAFSLRLHRARRRLMKELEANGSPRPTTTPRQEVSFR